MKWLILVLVLLFLGLLQSCTTERKVLNYLSKNPLLGATFCATKYPIKTDYIKGKDSLRIDTITIKGDSVICPPNTVATKVKCPDAKILERWNYRTDTLIKENTARLDSLQIIYITKDKEYQKEKIAKETSQNKATKRLYYIIGLLAIFGVGIVLKIKRII